MGMCLIRLSVVEALSNSVSVLGKWLQKTLNTLFLGQEWHVRVYADNSLYCTLPNLLISRCPRAHFRKYDSESIVLEENHMLVATNLRKATWISATRIFSHLSRGTKSIRNPWSRLIEREWVVLDKYSLFPINAFWDMPILVLSLSERRCSFENLK